jgi:hypothetical protein
MRIIVSYYARDTYDIPDEQWREAMALCAGDEDAAFDFVMGKGEDFLCDTDVTDRYVETIQE